MNWWTISYFLDLQPASLPTPAGFGLPSLYNHLNQFLKINLSLYLPYYLCFYVQLMKPERVYFVTEDIWRQVGAEFGLLVY